MTPELLARTASLSVARAARWAGPLTDAFAHAACHTPQRQAAFIAQVGHESGGFRYVRELWGPTPAQARYEGRADLGNTEPGDGFHFRGRGLLQITGRANYRHVTQRLHGWGAPDFVAEPQALELPHWAALSAADYWRAHDLNQYADTGAFRTLTRKINGGHNGLSDRLARWDHAKRVLGA